MDKTRHPESAREALIFTVAAASSLFFFHLVYGGFYPNKHGMMGADYTYFIPRLLDGYYWYHLNGPWQVPWFTPSFCGGLPFFGNPQSMYYSVPQALTVFFGPLKAVYYTVLLFALAGFIGFYLLLRGAFRVSRPLAYLGAALFMFNGFYAHRMIVGHFAFHAYQLLPLACYFLMRPLPERKKGPGLAARVLMDSMTAGSVFAYMLYSGMVVPGPPVVLSVTLVGFICVSARCVGTKLFFGRLALAGVHALILGAARIVAMGSFMESFTRSNYHFPGGTETLGKLAFFVVQILFFWPDRKLIINWPFISREGNRYIYDWHDYEYSVTIIPLIIIITSVYIFLRRAYKKGWPISWPLLAPAVMVVLIAAFPLALNYSFSSPWFEMAVKQTPVLSKYSKYIVWYAALIPMAIIIPLITLERLRLGERTTRAVAVVAVLLAAVQIWGQDRNHYQTYNGYDHRKIEAAGAALGNGAADPVVERIVDQSRSDWSRALNKTTPMGG
ncbi:MAG: hypothetical protein OEZ04_09020, partial [Nitrospinota bacterium]|nr:hypothetical protein [Nitrospinota bacterium]